MKLYLLLFLAALALTACNVAGGVVTTAGSIANVISHSQQACADLALLGAANNTIASQVAAANPNNTKIQSIATAVTTGAAITNADCQLLAASFVAEAPPSLLHTHIRINPLVLAHAK